MQEDQQEDQKSFHSTIAFNQVKLRDIGSDLARELKSFKRESVKIIIHHFAISY
jgi:hypothetical protein